MLAEMIITSDKVRNAVARKCNPSNVDDILQEAAIRALEAERRGVEVTNAEAFCVTTAKNTAGNIHRASKRLKRGAGMVRSLTVDVVATVATPLGDLIEKERLDEIRRQIDSKLWMLSNSQRLVFTMRKGEGLGIQEIADKLETTYQNVARLMASAIKAINRG